MLLIAVAALKLFKQNTPNFPNTQTTPFGFVCLASLSFLKFFFWGGLSMWLLFSLPIPLILLYKTAEANQAKIELFPEGDGGKESELDRQNCFE